MTRSLLGIALIGFCASVFAQAPKDGALRETILAQDAAFFKAFNDCDFEGWKKYLADDIEFYQDNDKVTTSRQQLEPSFLGRCKNANTTICDAN